jgi:PAS domain S-box-containing protein
MSDARAGVGVLLVDDARAGKAAASALESRDGGFDVSVETSGTAALDRLDATTDVDCVVSDYRLPGMDGLELLERVREDDPDLPFVLFTGEGSEAIASEAFSLGATDYVVKTGETDQYDRLADGILDAVDRYRSRPNYEEIFEKAGVGMTIRDVDTRELIDVNRRYCDMLGYDYEECLDLSLEAFTADVEGYSAARAGEVVDRALEDGPHTFEWPDERKDGERIWTEVTLDRAEIDGRDRLLATIRDVTDRKEQERQLSTLVSNLPGIAYRCRMERGWPMELVRGDAEEMVGYSSESIEAGQVSWGADVIHPDHRGRAWDVIQDAVERREPFTLTYRVRTADGEDRWLWEQGRAIRSPTGEVDVLEGFITDVTPRKERERALTALHDAAADLENAERRETVFDIVVDTAEKVLDLSLVVVATVEDDALVKTAGTLGRDGEASFDELPLEEDSLAVRSVQRGATIVADDLREYDVTPADPGYRSVLTVPIGDAGVFQAVSRDVGAFDETDRELAEVLMTHAAQVLDRIDREADLRETNERLQAILDHTTALIYVKDLDGRYTLVNDRYAEVLGLDEAEVLGKTDWEIQDEEYAAEVRTNDRRAIEEERPVEIEERAHRGGDVRTYYSVKVPLYDEGEDPTGVCGISTDITELKRREQELHQQKERLDQFASVVSHDLRNPLTVANGKLEQARAERDGEHLADVADALERMEAIVEDVLTMARQGHDVGEADRDLVDLGSTIESCWATVATGDAALEVETDAAIRADADRLRRALENLFRNAVEHGTPEVIEVGDLEDGFYVADDGPGIPTSERGSIFEPGHSSSANGTGFGLAIVRGIVQAHGWSIEATESDAGGARFEISGVDRLE